jgi:hypothetical protein
VEIVLDKVALGQFSLIALPFSLVTSPLTVGIHSSIIRAVTIDHLAVAVPKDSVSPHTRPGVCVASFFAVDSRNTSAVIRALTTCSSYDELTDRDCLATGAKEKEKMAKPL